MNVDTTKKSPRVYIELTAVWGNDDAESKIKVSRLRWKRIQAGMEYETSAWAWYEGERISAHWYFINGLVSVSCDGDPECVMQLPVGELFAQISS